MNTNEKNTSCQIGCWALAAGIGLVVFVGILVFGDMGWLGAIFLSGLAFGVSGALLSWFVCKPLPPLGSVTVGGDAVSAPLILCSLFFTERCCSCRFDIF